MGFELPNDTRDDSLLPSLDVSAIPGAAIVLRQGLRANDFQLRLLCITAPSDRWIPGAEELILDRATAVTKQAVAGVIERWDASAIATTSNRFEQHFTARVLDDETTLSVKGRYFIGFVGENRTGILCSAVCIDTISEPGDRALHCSKIIDTMATEGPFLSPPSPDFVARSILLVSEHPYGAAVCFIIAAALTVSLLLWHRPRPRPG